MSTTFTATGPGVNFARLRHQIDELLVGKTSWIPLKCMGWYYPEGLSDEVFAKGEILLLGKGSTRGVFARWQEQKISFELTSLAGDTDWEVARWLALPIIRDGGVVLNDEGKQLSEAEVEPAAFKQRVEEIRKGELGTARSISAKEGNLRFPVAHYELLLTKEELAGGKNDAAIMESLAKQCFHYGNAHVAKVMELERPDGTRQLFCLYSSISTLVPADIPAMAFGGPDGEYTKTPVPIERVKEVIGKFMVPVGQYIYIPPIKWSDEPQLLEQITGKSTKELLASLNEQLVRTLGEMPVLVAILMIMADGKVEEKEFSAFDEYLRKIAMDSNDKSFFAIGSRHALAGMREMMARFRTMKYHEHMTLLQLGVGQLNLRLSPEGAKAYKEKLFGLAETIAKSTAAGGANVGQQEQKILTWLRSLLLGEK